jgi:hypothetical protein
MVPLEDFPLAFPFAVQLLGYSETSSLAGMGVGSKMPISRGRSIRRGHAEREVGDDIAIMGVVVGMWGSRLRSSGVLPL